MYAKKDSLSKFPTHNPTSKSKQGTNPTKTTVFIVVICFSQVVNYKRKEIIIIKKMLSKIFKMFCNTKLRKDVRLQNNISDSSSNPALS